MLAIVVVLFASMVSIGIFATYRDIERYTSKDPYYRVLPPPAVDPEALDWPGLEESLRRMEQGQPKTIRLTAKDFQNLLGQHPAHPAPHMKARVMEDKLVVTSGIPLEDMRFFRDRFLVGEFEVEPVRDGRNWRLAVIGIRVDEEDLEEGHLELLAPRAEMYLNPLIAGDALLGRVTRIVPHIYVEGGELVLSSEAPPEEN